MQRQGKNKLIIGITGSFGSGKSTVARFFRQAGVKVIDADKIAHTFLTPKSKAYKKIIRLCGREIIGNDNLLQRSKISRFIFKKKALVRKLNNIIHPEVIRAIKNQIRLAREKTVIIDAPLLVEVGLQNKVNKLIVVSLDRKKQIERLRRKTALSRQEIIARIRSQIPLRAKMRLADFIIDNSGSLKETRKQVTAIRRQLWKS